MRLELNRRTMQMQLVNPTKVNTAELFNVIKYRFRAHITMLDIKDDEIQNIINQVSRGVRNTHYLVDRMNPRRLGLIAAFVVSRFQQSRA